MGVRALQTYLESYCESAIPIESIEELAEKRREYTDQELVIVVDGLNWVLNIYENLPSIGGAQLKEYVEKVKIFVQSFRNIGIRLVFFYDGTTVKKKRRTWVERRESNIKILYDILDVLHEGIPSNVCQVSVLPSGICHQTKVILEKLCNCELVVSVLECDEEIADYARRKDAFGVLANDSDFIIYDIGRAFYFDMAGLNLQMMKTRVYYPEVLARSLGLNKFQLPLLATLMGNDFVKYSELQRCHFKLTEGKGRDVKYLVPKIALYIQSLPADYLERKVIMGVAKFVFNNTFRAREIEDSVVSYLTLEWPEEEDNEKKDGRWRVTHRVPVMQWNRGSGRLEERGEGFGENWSRSTKDDKWRRVEENRTNWREKPRENWRQVCADNRRQVEDVWLKLVREVQKLHCKNAFPHQIYGIMKQMTFESCSSLEDYRITPRDLPIFAELTQELRQRLYGILLQQKPVSPGSHEVEEWCMAGPRSLDRPCYNPAVAPGIIHPGLLALWSDEDRPLGRISDIRWTLFVHSVSPNLDVKRVRMLPPHLVVPTLVLYYIIHYKGPGRLEEWEAEVLLATATLMRHYGPRELAEISPDPMIVRGIRISSLIMGANDVIYCLQAACGYPLSFLETLPWNFFDGKLFQVKYKEAKQGGISHAQLCENRDDSLEEFQQARSVIFDDSDN